MSHHTVIRRALPVLIGLFLLLTAPQGHTTPSLLAGDDTKVGTGGG